MGACRCGRRLRPAERAAAAAAPQELMKTRSGRQLAQQRHEYMTGFLEQFEAEWQGQR
jgi:HD superfamily phosphodiesterase